MDRKRVDRYNKIATFELSIALLFSGGAFVLSLNGTTVFGLMFVFAFIVAAVALQKNNFKITITKNAKYILSIVCLVLISIVLNFQEFTLTVSGRCLLAIAIAIGIASTFEDKKARINAFIKVIYFYSFLALALWFLFVLVGIPHSFLPSISSNSNKDIVYDTLILFNIGRGYTRNCGPFWEPSIFAGFISIALVLLKMQGSGFLQNKKKYLILCLTLFSTQSSGGILLFLLFIMMSVWQNEGGIRNNMIVKLAFVVGVIFVIVGWGYLESLLLQINYSMFSKIFNITENGSSLTRLESFKVDFYIFANSPIFGVGIDKMETEFLRLRDILCTVTGMAHTSTSTEYMAAFGLGGIWINWLWIKGAISNSKNVLTGVLLIMILAIMLNVAPQINFPLTYFLLFVLLKQDAHEDAVDE